MSNTQKFDRKARLSVLAKAPAERLNARWADWTQRHGAPEHTVLRSPEIGTVMVRGRAGAIGAPFNLGEITVTRCSVQLEGGAVGHGYVQGRDKAAAIAAACCDALAQAGQDVAIDSDVTTPLATELEAGQASRAAKAAATKVEFFTLVRGES